MKIYHGSIFKSVKAGGYVVNWKEGKRTRRRFINENKFKTRINAEKEAKRMCVDIKSSWYIYRNAVPYIEVIVQHEGKRYEKRFKLSKTSEKEARRKAQEWLEQKNDELKLSHDSDLPPSGTNHISESIKQHIAGFFDGDGSLTYVTNGLVMAFTQSMNSNCPPTLKHVQSIYGGNISTYYSTNAKMKKPRYTLRITKTEQHYDLLRDLELYCIVKRPQVSEALQYYKVRRAGGVYELKTLKRKITKMKKEYATIPIDTVKITPAYVSGLFDAEGCVNLRTSGDLRVELSQNACPRILYAIRDRYGAGYVDKRETRVTFSTNTSVSFMQSILPYSIRKREELKVALKYQQNPRKRKKDGGFEECYPKLKKLKQI
jgi:hypothetical protein